MKLNCLIILVFVSLSARAQVFEAGVFVGGSNAISDLGSEWYINPNSEAYGLIFKWNKSLRYSWRISASQTQLIMDDSRSNIPARQNRGFYAQTKLKDLTAGLEVNFKSFELHRYNSSWSPYIASGISFYEYDDKYFNQTTSTYDYSTKRKFALPLIFGVKVKASQVFVLALESGIRYSFNDNLDGSSPIEYANESDLFGGMSSKDWYVFSGMTLTYSFGQKPCTQCYN